MVLCLARAGAADMKGVHLNLLAGLNNKVRKIIVSHPVIKIRGQQKPL